MPLNSFKQSPNPNLDQTLRAFSSSSLRTIELQNTQSSTHKQMQIRQTPQHTTKNL